MRVIDDKGRIFGRINVIDFAIVAFALMFIPMAYFGYKAFRAGYGPGQRWVEVEAKFSELEPELAAVIIKGDVADDIFNKKCGEVLEIKETKPSEVALLVDNRSMAILSHPYKKDVRVLLNILCAKKAGILFYNESPVRIGGMLDFSTDLYTVNGKVLSIKYEQ